MPSRTDVILDAARRAAAYLEGVSDRTVAPSPDAVARIAALREPLPADPTPDARVLALLDDIGSPATVANAGGRYFGFVNGGALPATVAANMLAAAWDQNMGLRVMSPIAALLEDIALEWIRELLHLPQGVAGTLVTGATMANLSCLAAARTALLSKQGWDVESQGLFGAPPITVVVGEEVHVSVQKALAILGFGRNRVVTVPADSQGRMRADRLPKITSPSIVCLQAGNVNSGAFDPAQEICPAIPRDLAWIHADGAFGLWAACSPSHAHLVRGFDQADSWATDGHKWPNLPYDCGIAFVRHPAALHKALSMQAAYLPASNDREPAQWTPEMSRRARGVEAWAAIKSLGRSGLAELIDRTCRHAQRFAEKLQAAGFEIVNEVVINQVLVSFGSPEKTQAVVRAVQADGTCWCGGTVWQGRHAMRISISSWVTTEEDVDKSVDAMIRAAKHV